MEKFSKIFAILAVLFSSVGFLITLAKIYFKIRAESHLAFELYRRQLLETTLKTERDGIIGMSDERMEGLQRAVLNVAKATMSPFDYELVMDSLTQQSIKGRKLYLQKLLILEQEKRHQLGPPKYQEENNQPMLPFHKLEHEPV